MGDKRRFTDRVRFTKVDPGTPTKHQRMMVHPDYSLGQAAFACGESFNHEQSIEWQIGYKDAREAK
jgi:hypothetical protein